MILTKLYPIDSIEELDNEEKKKAYKACIRSDEIVRYYILASMSNVL